ncbi:MAG: hypothetical protein IT519_04565 [Burkholderiales bacterium]|jgi:hypothetical protein|nr:hypothetical protein [Burkholderiales bacterium]
MIVRRHRRIAFAAGALFATFSSIAEAQWVLLARHVIGRVETMSQQSKAAGGPSYDTATVMLDAAPDKVYAAVVSHVRARTDLAVTQNDPSAMVVQFSNGQQIAGIKVNPMGDNLTQLLVTSAHAASQPNAADLVVDAVLRVCREMKVECARPVR